MQKVHSYIFYERYSLIFQRWFLIPQAPSEHMGVAGLCLCLPSHSDPVSPKPPIGSQSKVDAQQASGTQGMCQASPQTTVWVSWRRESGRGEVRRCEPRVNMAPGQ